MTCGRVGTWRRVLMQAVNDVDFELVAKFESLVSLQYQMQGFIIEQDAQNFLRFDVYGDGGANPRLFAAKFVNGVADGVGERCGAGVVAGVVACRSGG